MTKLAKPAGNWTDYEDRELRKGVRLQQSFEEIAAHLNRQIKSVKIRAAVLGQIGRM